MLWLWDKNTTWIFNISFQDVADKSKWDLIIKTVYCTLKETAIKFVAGILMVLKVISRKPNKEF